MLISCGSGDLWQSYLRTLALANVHLDLNQDIAIGQKPAHLMNILEQNSPADGTLLHLTIRCCLLLNQTCTLWTHHCWMICPLFFAGYIAKAGQKYHCYYGWLVAEYQHMPYNCTKMHVSKQWGGHHPWHILRSQLRIGLGVSCTKKVPIWGSVQASLILKIRDFCAHNWSKIE